MGYIELASMRGVKGNESDDPESHHPVEQMAMTQAMEKKKAAAAHIAKMIQEVFFVIGEVWSCEL